MGFKMLWAEVSPCIRRDTWRCRAASTSGLSGDTSHQPLDDELWVTWEAAHFRSSGSCPQQTSNSSSLNRRKRVWLMHGRARRTHPQDRHEGIGGSAQVSKEWVRVEPERNVLSPGRSGCASPSYHSFLRDASCISTFQILSSGSSLESLLLFFFSLYVSIIYVVLRIWLTTCPVLGFISWILPNLCSA